jgi:CRISPR/Cas system-associated exonuclease Cas4 (RecB family)
MTDPRKHLPSASGFPRYALCPGSFLAEQAVDWKEDPDPDAESGTRIHAALACDPVILGADEIPLILSAEELETGIQCRSLGDRVILETLGPALGAAIVTDNDVREQRLWCPDPDTLAPLFSGQFDLLVRGNGAVVVLDYKTGRHEIEAESSWQLRALAALVVENGLVDDSERLFLAIIQPWASRQTKVVEYDVRDRRAALESSRAMAMAVVKPGQPRVPSEVGCRYCRAKATCPEAQAVVAKTANLTLPDGRAGEVLDAGTVAWLLDRCSLAERVIGGIRARAKSMLMEKPGSVPGWQLRPGSLRQKIVDVSGLWKRMAPMDVSPDEFAAACGMTKTDFKSLVRATLGLKGGQLDIKMAELLEGLVEEKQTAPQLQRIGETPTHNADTA